MNTETLKTQLRQLRLATAAAELQEVLAAQKKNVSLDWISTLFTRELDARRERAVAARIKCAQFPEVTSLEAFDWDFNPDINRQVIEELAELKFVEGNEIALFVGKPGTGKTHLALAIGLRAVHRGHRVFCTSVKRLAAQIVLERARNNLDNLFKRVLSSRLLILDDWGVVSMKSDVAEEVFDLLDRRRYSSAMILTSNRDPDEWGVVFPDPVLASAAIDRIFDRAHIVTFVGESYRAKGRITLPTTVRSQKIRGDELEVN